MSLYKAPPMGHCSALIKVTSVTIIKVSWCDGFSHLPCVSDVAGLWEPVVRSLQLVHICRHHAHLQTLGLQTERTAHGHRKTVLQQLPWYWLVHWFIHLLVNLLFIMSFYKVVGSIVCRPQYVGVCERSRWWLVSVTVFRVPGVSGWFLSAGQWINDDTDH